MFSQHAEGHALLQEDAQLVPVLELHLEETEQSCGERLTPTPPPWSASILTSAHPDQPHPDQSQVRSS